MNLWEAEKLATDLIKKHLGNTWSFRWNRRKKAFGLCHYGHNTIELSRILTETETDHAIRQTILHEIAHAIAGYRAGHGPEWKAVARRLGVENPKCKRSATGDTKLNYKWAIKHNGRVIKGYFRRPNRNIEQSISELYITGRPETKGQLYIERVS